MDHMDRENYQLVGRVVLMLIPCVECGKRYYTEESPLWFHCDSCLKPKKQQARQPERVIYCYCDGCGSDYPNHYLHYDEQFDGFFCPKCEVKET
jgi:hypothetical protein